MCVYGGTRRSIATYCTISCLEFIEDDLVSGEVNVQLLVPESVVGACLGGPARQPFSRVKRGA